ncbi:MAG: HEPN domain-containing protein [Candidatus Daviesbacteria bacterium]|nr:HEPN domain-containing protein [Candidatus Daviesbacteria bacterium]
MVNSKIVEGWINKANEDLLYAKASVDEKLEFYAQICFHLHQAAEKFLKSYIVAKELNFQKIHDLTRLLQICAKDDTDFNSLNDLVIELNPYYIEARYPEFIISVDKSQTEKALKTAEQIAGFVKFKLSLVQLG